MLNSDLIHAAVIVVVVLVTAVLSAIHDIGAPETGYVLTAVVGYAAGRSGTISPSP